MDATLNQTLPPHSSRISFVLVRPSHPGNIGAAARAIKTMGFTDLRVVAPVDPEYRTLLKVNMQDAFEADEIFTVLMGEVPEMRRQFIEENAKLVKELDI